MANGKMLRLLVSASCTVSLAATGATLQPPTVATPAVKTKICIVLPKAQLGQGTSGEDVAEPVRATLTAYLGGPTTELVAVDARIPVQINAESSSAGCSYVLYTSLIQKKAGGGLGKMLAAAAPLAKVASVAGAGMVGMAGMGGMGSRYGAMMATQTVANVASTAAATSYAQEAQEQAMEQAMAALGGATRTRVKKGDQITLEYRMVKTGEENALIAQSAIAKASENGEDLVSPLIEEAATQLLAAIGGR